MPSGEAYLLSGGAKARVRVTRVRVGVEVRVRLGFRPRLRAGSGLAQGWLRAGSGLAQSAVESGQAEVRRVGAPLLQLKRRGLVLVLLEQGPAHRELEPSRAPRLELQRGPHVHAERDLQRLARRKLRDELGGVLQ